MQNHSHIVMRWRVTRFLFSNERMAWLWTIVRVYVGWQWLLSGWGKIHNPAWVGSSAGTAISGFFNGALSKMAGPHPDVSQWYGWFIQHIAVPNSVTFSYLISFGELLVGVGLILGIFTSISAFFGIVMNFNFLLSGSLSINPQLIILQLLIILAGRISGRIGLEEYILPMMSRMKR